MTLDPLPEPKSASDTRMHVAPTRHRPKRSFTRLSPAFHADTACRTGHAELASFCT